MLMSIYMCNTMAGRIPTLHDLLNNYHQIHFSLVDKTIAGFMDG